MSEYYGNGVGRHLQANEKQYTSVVFQKNKPPIAEEFNLLTDIAENSRKDILRANIPSGFISDPFDPKSDYTFNRKASNLFWLGKNRSGGIEDIPHAVVNGWVIPVAGTLSSDLRNAIKLPPPSSSASETEVNFVFLEVWKGQISPDGDANKPSEDQVYRFGNVEYGGTNLTNQILDPRFNVETSERIQVQYRIRVVDSVNPETAPYGFNSSIKAQGPLDAPISSSNPSFQYENMGEELGDAGLWRAGIENNISSDGTSVVSTSPLDTSDGYVYAIPLCMVFRRTSAGWNIGQQLGAIDRNPNMTDRSQAEVLPTIQLASDLAVDDSLISVTVSQTETKFPDSNGVIRIGDELITYTSWSGNTITIDQRGYKQTHVSPHQEDDEVTHATGHPLGLFADQIAEDDVLDLRHVVNISGFSYDDLLQHNFHKLAKGDLQTMWKRSEGNLKGTKHFQVDQFSTSGIGTLPVEERDAPDGFRKVFSDAAALQPSNLLAFRSSSTVADSNFYSFNVTSATSYTDTGAATWAQDDSLTIPLSDLQNTFKSADTKKVRFVHPYEYTETAHDPVKLWFGDTNPDNGDPDFQAPFNARGDDPPFTVLGKKASGLTGSQEEGTASTIAFEQDEILIEGGAVDFSSVASDLADQEAWIFIDEVSAFSDIHGAYKIVGQGTINSAALQVVRADGSAPGFPDTSPDFNTSTTGDWKILLEECSEEDDALYVSFNRAFSDKYLYLAFDVLYHPNRGLSRTPDRPLYTRLVPGGTTPYLRENTFENLISSTAATVKHFPQVPFESYPLERDATNTRNNQDVTTNVETTWAEAYVDRGSKTALFQPIQIADFQVNVSTNASNMSYNTGPGADPAIGFELDSGDPCYFFASEVLPSPGRIDLPFTKSTSGTAPYGINSTFLALNSGSATNEEVVVNRVQAIYDPVNLTASDYDTLVDLASLGSGPGASGDALVCRLYDKGGVRGLELPPHFGVARLFGVYEADDYYTNDSEFTAGSNYTAKKTSYDGTNLIRIDADARSLVITEDNTFVIPEDAFDSDFLSADFSTVPIVFEFSAFMFEDWTADLVRINTVDITSTPSDKTFEMLVNGPCNSNDTFYSVATRVPYQGNINGTMPISTTDSSSTQFEDYRYKSGADTKTEIDNLRTPLDLRDARVENPAKLEILAAMPFATTLGTGRLSGKPVVGSYTDIGYISQSGFPDSVDAQRTAKTRGLVIEDLANPNSLPDVLTGLSERLPLGLLGNDHLFLGDGMYGSQKTFWTDIGLDMKGFADYDNNTQLSKNFQEGKVLFSDGTSGGNDAADVEYTGAADMFRTLRGGPLTVASGDNPGGAFVLGGDRVYKEFPELRSFESEYMELLKERFQAGGAIGTDAELEEEIAKIQAKYRKRLQIHGSVLFGVAFLVRTQKEEVTTNNYEFNYGDELQMMVATGASFGKDELLDIVDSNALSKEFVDLLIQLHPTGIGEGFCAADRYHIEGRPLQKPNKDEKGLDFDVYKGTKPLGTIHTSICP